MLTLLPLGANSGRGICFKAADETYLGKLKHALLALQAIDPM